MTDYVLVRTDDRADLLPLFCDSAARRVLIELQDVVGPHDHGGGSFS